MQKSSIDIGVDTIQKVCKNLSSKPGVYRMLDDKGKVLYVGKAKNLKNRVINYTRPADLPMRLKRMISETRKMEIIETHTEVEALLLEFNLIKELNPLYNILLKDGKSYPYILITKDHDYPRLTKHRDEKSIEGDYFGPFATVGAVNKTVTILQKVFQIRNCLDSYFAARKRPCLQYHIKRCSAPCVGLIKQSDYKAQVSDAIAFLKGKNSEIQKRYSDKMKQASEKMDYEKAALYRDRIRALSSVQSAQTINVSHLKDADIFAVTSDNSLVCISVFFIRNGGNFGNATFFPKKDENETDTAILKRFIIHFYAKNPIISTILTNIKSDENDIIAKAFSKELERNVTIKTPQRGDSKKIVTMALQNATAALKRHKAEKSNDEAGLKRVQEIFELDKTPQRIEVYDNSHTGGESMIGGMIVATEEGFRKSAYRRFNIKNAIASDDYGMMHEVISRRFANAQKFDENGNINPDWPDLLLIDGGKGQLSSVTKALEELGIYNQLTVVAIAKGPDRNAGREDFYMNERTAFRLPINDIGLFYMQRLRDEAHRFAINSMRIKRAKAQTKSPLDDITGIGAKRKKALLSHFGSGKAVTTASLKDLEKIEGISKSLAKRIYNQFNT
jgi:excinuclease ABC subunit C